MIAMAMDVKISSNAEDTDPAETAEWLDSFGELREDCHRLHTPESFLWFRILGEVEIAEGRLFVCHCSLTPI